VLDGERGGLQPEWTPSLFMRLPMWVRMVVRRNGQRRRYWEPDKPSTSMPRISRSSGVRDWRLYLA
jgi:hypothetical protein